MSGIHIIILFILSVLLVGLFFAMKVHFKNSVVDSEPDFITDINDKLDRHIRKIDVGFKKEWYLATLMIAPLILGVLMFIGSGSGPMSVIIGCLGFLVPELVMLAMKQEKQKKFEKRYAKSLEQLGSSLRAGMSIAQAVEDVANCKFVHESMRKKYAKISSDLQMGLTVAEAFHRFEAGTGSKDAKDLAVAIDVQDNVGGHEADVIKEVADNIYGRMMLRREIKSLFASTSAMCWIMDFICPIVTVGFTLMNADFMSLYFSNPLYTVVFIILVAMMVIGSFINHKTIARIKKGA